MEAEIEKITDLIRKSFNGGAWHGPAVMEIIQDISPDQALARLPNTHSVIELVAHMTSWRRYVAKKLEGDTTFKVTNETNFPSVQDWPAVLEALIQSQRALIDAIATTPAGKLDEHVPGKTPPVTFYTLLHGIVHHDLYHAGQLKLILKATAAQSL